MKQLTKEQQKMVEDNHNLIYQYIIDNKLNYEEHYGTLAIGLCRASQIYDDKRGSFGTIAYKCMQNQMRKLWRNNNKQSTIPDTMVQYCDITQDDSEEIKTIKDKLADTCSVCNDVVNDIMKKEFIKNLSEKEKQVINYLLQGLTHNQIADMFKCSRRNITYIVKRIREKWVVYNN